MSVAMPPEAAVWWLRLALGDLAAARGLLLAEGVAPRQAAYLAQQAAEKALKATIALEGGEPPLTHDLIFLTASARRKPGCARSKSTSSRFQTPRLPPATRTPKTSRMTTTSRSCW